MSRPSTLILAADDPVPGKILVLAGLQHCAVILGVGIAMPLLVLARGDLDPQTTRQMLSLALVGLGLATILQIQRGKIFGSGYLAPATFTAAYLPPCLSAMETGGPALVMGMLIFAGLVQMALAPALRRLRPYLPPEIGGLAVLMIGIILGLLGFRLIAEIGTAHVVTHAGIGLSWLGGITLAAIVAFNIWGTGNVRLYGTLLGIIGGCVAALAYGAMDGATLVDDLVTQGVALPMPMLQMPSFDPLLASEFAISAVACSLRAMGDLITCQKIEDTRWVRPDMTRIRGGILADGLGTLLGGALGSPIGTNTFSGSIGLASATGIAARRIGYGIAGWCFLIALLPGAMSFFIAIPKPVLGGVLIFAAAYIMLNGILVIVSRLMDARRILMIGIPLVLGLSRSVYPEVYTSLPAEMMAVFGSDLMVTIGSALLLNLIFRIGVSQNASLTLPASELQPDRLENWVREQGSHWGARADVMRAVSHALVEFADGRDGLMTPETDIRIDLSFDEYHIDLRLTYAGFPLSFEDSAPIRQEELADIDMDMVEARLRAILLRRLADKVSIRPPANGQQSIDMRFDH
ncbi:MAG: xanthine permease [Alphaproteobacteria bacterium]|nr:xanthine permease [Alphaproteobacteria bacterium]MBU0795747.1 xanthine permease [Alphaproteobacteria bacterium]MBU0887370.1 xanthine permease [Alphaproteobacteria bacterium]MBU1811749.1 xanthine permease [Alphaproteobacteria bacterium]